MSISSEITSIGENLKADYTALETLGVSVEDKNIENIKDMANQIYAKFPKTSYAEGSNITLSNTLKGKIDFEDDIVGYGDTSQKSYTGKNLFPRITFSRTINGVTVTANNDGIVTIKGTATEAVNHPIWGAWGSSTTLFTLPAGTYTASGIGTRQQSPRINIVTNGTTSIFITSTTQTLSTDTNVTGIFIWVDAGTTVDTTFKYQIEQGTTATDWEPYVGGIASPNPSYPQEVKVVRGKNILPFKFNSVERNGITLTANDDGTITLNGTASANTTFGGDTLLSFTLKKGTYTFSITNPMISGSNISIYYGTNSVLKTLGTITSTNITIDEDTTYQWFRLSIYIPSGTTYNNVILKPMIEERKYSYPLSTL